jgi:peptide deformylase
MRLKIVQAGEAVLRTPAVTLSADDVRGEAVQQLIASMWDTLRDAPGVGLAAPQIGLGVQLAVIEDRAEYQKSVPAEVLRDRERSPVPFHVIVNPILTIVGEETAEHFEGCLSVSGYSALVSRARQVRVECLDERGEPRVIEASGWYARILQHEIDHLHGTMYVDRMRPRSFMTVENLGRYWSARPVAEVQSILETDD